MKKIKGYKAFDKDMKCRSFQYEEGKTYETKTAKICDSGFHFCTNPFDVLNYYNLTDSEFHEVESIGKTNRCKEDSKISTTKIKIGAKLDLNGFLKASIDFILDSCKPTVKQKKDDKKDHAKIGFLKASIDFILDSCKPTVKQKKDDKKDHAKIGAKLDLNGFLKASIDFILDSCKPTVKQKKDDKKDHAKIGSSGDYAQIGSSGDSAKIGSSGYSAKIGSSGYSAKIGSSGYSAQIDSTGKHSVLMCAGDNSTARGKKGSWITLSEWEYSNEESCNIPMCVKTIKIDGKKYKEDTFYKLEKCKIKEV